MANKKRYAFHDGMFHADDVFACAMLRAAGHTFTVERVSNSDTEALARADMRIDVGRKYDPETGDFDHHQGGIDPRPSGVPYASAGLIWRHFGMTVCRRSERAFAIVDQELVSGIDFRDVNKQFLKRQYPLQRTVSDIVVDANPVWDVEEPDFTSYFERAVEHAVFTLVTMVERALGRDRAEMFVSQAPTALDGTVVLLSKACPWQEHVRKYFPQARFVHYPSKGLWYVQVVPGRNDSMLFPEAWAGLHDEDLVSYSGIPAAKFCHAARHIATASSKEGALMLAEKALLESSRNAHAYPPG